MFPSAGIPRAIASVEESVGVMQALFAPFPEAAFPRTLNAASLAGLLAVPSVAVSTCQKTIPRLVLP